MTSMNNIRIFIMKICYICCAIAMSYIAISCLSENKIIDRSSPVLIVNLDSTKVSEFKYSDIFKSVTAIELDEKDALLGGIDKMQIYKSQLFVLDSRSTKGVYIFDRKGTFMRKIGNIGLAPDEYVSCDDFTINIDDNELYIFDSLQNKIYRYDISSGKFKGGILMDKNIHFNYIAYNSGCLYGAQTFFQPSKEDRYYLLQQVDVKSGERIAQWMDASEYNKGWNDELIHGNVFYNIGKNEDLFIMGLMDTIMSIKEQRISPYMAIQSEGIVLKKDILEDEKLLTLDPRVRSRNILSLINRLNKQGKIQHISHIYKYKDQLFFECMRKSNQQVQHDIKSGRTLVYEKTLNDILFTIKPDYSHIPIFLCSDSLGVYFYVTPECFSELQYFEKENYISDKLKNKESIRKLRDESNPLVLYYEFK